ncbi:MAG: hypothetical protein HQL31_11015, partial [Planctomycetes bacterium]|nr:hypothetical protein [Planctomycetota bacterium]
MSGRVHRVGVPGWLLLGIALCACLMLDAGEPKARVLLHVPLQDSIVPEIGSVAAGSPKTGWQRVAGCFGQAVALDAIRSRLAFSVPLDRLRGSLSFRMRLFQTPRKAVKPIPILRLRGGAQTLTIRAEINACNSLLLAANNYRVRLAKSAEAAKWTEGWHLVVFTWTDTWLHWYVDGVALPTMLYSGGDDETDRPITGRLEKGFAFPEPETGTRLEFFDTDAQVAVQDLSVYNWAISSQSALRLAAAAEPSVAEPPLEAVVDVLWGPGAKRVDLIVDPAPVGLSPASAELRVVNTLTRKEVGRARISAFPRNLGVACVDVPDFGSGVFQVQVNFEDEEGKPLACANSSTYAFDRGAYPWLWNGVGISDTVPE